MQIAFHAVLLSDNDSWLVKRRRALLERKPPPLDLDDECQIADAAILLLPPCRKTVTSKGGRWVCLIRPLFRVAEVVDSYGAVKVPVTEVVLS
jgi:hypothetical protein